MIFGVAFYSFTIGNLQSIISTLDIKASHLSAKLKTLKSFAERTALPDNLNLKIKRFLENNNDNDISIQNYKALLNQLPATLRFEVLQTSFGSIIQKIKFFQNKEAEFLWNFLPALKPMKVFSKDILYNQSDHPEEVFFISKGRVKLFVDINLGKLDTPINVPFNMYVQGSYFGELEILDTAYKDSGRDGTAIVDSECHLLVIGHKDLKQILKKFKDVARQMKRTAKKRGIHHMQMIEEAKKKTMLNKH